MAYMSQEMKAQINAALKPVLAKYGVRGSLSVRNHSTIVLTLKSGRIDFIGNFNANAINRYPAGNRVIPANSTDIQINPYWYHEHFTGTAKDFLTDALKAMKSAGWYDRSDAMVDYFDTAYYVDINVGKWNKPYVVEA